MLEIHYIFFNLFICILLLSIAAGILSGITYIFSNQDRASIVSITACILLFWTIVGLYCSLNKTAAPIIKTTRPDTTQKIIIKENNEYKIIDSRDWDNQDYQIIFLNTEDNN
jgi:hypothetical protein